MMNEKQQNFIGIDISKLWFDASLLVVKTSGKQPVQTQRFDNNVTGIKAFEKWLKLFRVSYEENTLVVMENTGIYQRHLWSFCSDKNLPLYIGNAADIKWSFGIARGKNDRIDSIRLCNYAHKHADDLKATPRLNKKLVLLKDLMTSRTKLLGQMNAIKTYLKELKDINDKAVQKVMEQAHKTAIAGLSKSIKNIEVEILKIIKEDEMVLANYDLLKTIPGIGHITAVYLICCTNNFAIKVSGKQLACYAGVVPFEHRSGISVKGRSRVHRMANKDLKRLLHMAALSCIQNYAEFRDYYDRKKAEGKHSMSVLNAIRNKIVLRVAAVVNSRCPYVNNYEKAV
ncbi:MAG: IS110 family transposase [Chitinophagaceae bacterium]|nr:IS110 family transposase [Chitinophagaceae bacterium]